MLGGMWQRRKRPGRKPSFPGLMLAQDVQLPVAFVGDDHFHPPQNPRGLPLQHAVKEAALIQQQAGQTRGGVVAPRRLGDRVKIAIGQPTGRRAT